jgi:signal peptidase I
MTATSAMGASPGTARRLGFLDLFTRVAAGLFAALVVVRVFLFQPYLIPSAASEPTLYRGDYILVNRWSYGFSFTAPSENRLLPALPRRGDVVVFKLPRDGHTDYIKRLVGLPGDRIQMKGGTLWINDKPVSEQKIGVHTATDMGGLAPVTWIRETTPEGRSYTVQDHGTGFAADDTDVYVVPQNCFFVLGDNRDNSVDSRFSPGLPSNDPKLGGRGWDTRHDAILAEVGVGFVPRRNLVGRASFVLASWDIGMDEGDHSKASIAKPWTWFTYARPDRFFRRL